MSDAVATLKYGAASHTVPGVVGMSISSAVHEYGNTYSLPTNARVLRHGVEVGLDHIIQAGDHLEFVKKAGEKG